MYLLYYSINVMCSQLVLAFQASLMFSNLFNIVTSD
jgi:hypothetical protein